LSPAATRAATLAAIEVAADGFRLRVRLTPKAAADAIDGAGEDAAGAVHLKARVRAVPEKGAANAALEALLAKALGTSKSAIRVEKGSTGRVKIVAVRADQGALDRAKALLGPRTQ
jgi:uncharacterized protein YggU (UPF0235/DUF167 family)